MIKFLSKNQIIKRVIVTILLTMELLTVFAFDNNIDVYADSNSLRKTYLELMGGRNETEMSVDSMTMDDLKMLALYLSNFYMPFGTALDDAEDDYYKDNCITQLILLGYSREMATNLVDYIYNMNLSSATPLYMDIDAWQDSRWEYFNGAYSSVTDRMGFGSDAYDPGIDTNAITDNYKEVIGMKDDDYLPMTIFSYYMILTYYTYMQSMDYSYKYDYGTPSQYLDPDYYEWILDDGLDDDTFTNSSELTDDYRDALNALGYGLGDGATWHDVMHRVMLMHPAEFVIPKGDEFKTKDIQDVFPDWNLYFGDGSSIPLNATIGSKVENGELIGDAVIPLYYIDSAGNKVECFKFDFQVAKAIGNLYENLDSSNGLIGNALFNMEGYTNSGGEVSAMSDTQLYSSMFFFQKMYIDWVGNIICDFGDKRVVVLPACMNPYVICPIDNDSTKLSPYYNVISTYGMSTLGREGCIGVNANNFSWYIGNYYNAELKQARGSRTKASWSDGDSGILWWKKYGNGRALKDLVEDTLNAGINSSLDNPQIGFITGTPMAYEFTSANMEKYWFSDLVWYNSETNNVLKQNDFNVTDYIGVYRQGTKYFTDTAKFSDMKHSTFTNFITTDSSSVRGLRCIYLTYAFLYANKDGKFIGEDGFPVDCVIDWKYRDIFPKVSGRINFERLNTVGPNEMAEQTLSMVYYLLHPSKGIQYVATLFKRKIGGIILGWHEDIVGATSSNYTTGGTSYLGFSGYVTTPRIQEISWINLLVENYDSIIIYLIMIMSIILLAYVLLGQLSVQRGIIGLIMFAFLAFLPPVAINATVDIINTACDNIYSSKFDFWAITQTEAIVENFANYQSAETVEESFFYYMTDSSRYVTSEGNQAGLDTESGYSGVQIKWMTPKRSNYAAHALEKAKETSLAYSNLNLNTVISNALNDDTESFTAGADYLYRDYTDIYKHSTYAYNMSNSNAFRHFMNPDTSNPVDISTVFFKTPTKNLSPGYNQVYVDSLNVNNPRNSANLNAIKLYDGSSITDLVKYSSGTDPRDHFYAVNHGFLYSNSNTPNLSSYDIYNQAIILPLNHNVMYYNIHQQRESFENILNTNGNIDMSLSKLNQKGVGNFGADPSWFNFNVFEVAGTDSTSGTTQQHYQNMSTIYYMLYSESPFYYFDFNIRDQYYKYKGSNTFSPTEADKNNDFYRLWLYDNQTYFYNRADTAGDGYNELRDFMNFHDFFYYIVPLFKDGNALVDDFDKTFGMFTYDDCAFRINNEGKYCYGGVDGSEVCYDSIKDMVDGINSRGLKLTNEEKYKLWHDVNVWCLFYCYTTWLDTMQDCDYALPQDINIMGTNFRVEDPLDPTSYYIKDASGTIVSGRYMVFSRSEMKYYGLDWSDLTTVEQKIITVQDNVYSETLNLTNYLSMSDETLITSFAMIQLFEFNKEFSQSSFVGESYLLYPQGYELKAFSYDAYMRLILSNGTGDSLVTSPTEANYLGDGNSGNTSIYQRIMDKTSLFFGISLLINDFLAVYCIPAFKLFFLIAVFLTSIALIVASAVKLELNLINVVWKSLIAPLLSFIAISLGLGFLVSLFMSNGIETVHKRGVTISLGDPTMTVLVMIVINVAALVLYFKLCKKQLQDLIKYAKAVGTNIGGAITGLGHAAVGAFSANKLSQIAKNTSGVAGSAKQRGADNNPTSGKKGSAVGNIAAGAGAGAVAGAVAGAGSGNNTPDMPKAGDNKYDVKAADSRINSNTQKKLDEEAKLAAARSKTFNGKNEANAKKAGDLANQAKEDWAVANNKNVNLGDRMRAGRSAIANGMKAKGYGAKAAVGAKVAKGLGMDKRVSRAELESKSRIDALNSAIKDDKVRRNIGANRDRINANMSNADKKAKLDAFKSAKSRGMNAQSAARYAKKGSVGVDLKAANKAIKRHQKRASVAKTGRANVAKAIKKKVS